MSLGSRNRSPLITALGAIVAIVAIVGTEFLGWEWGSGQLTPTIIGVLVVGVVGLLFVWDRLR